MGFSNSFNMGSPYTFITEFSEKKATNAISLKSKRDQQLNIPCGKPRGMRSLSRFNKFITNQNFRSEVDIGGIK
jgi:hypothetical protein